MNTGTLLEDSKIMMMASRWSRPTEVCKTYSLVDLRTSLSSYEVASYSGNFLRNPESDLNVMTYDYMYVRT